MRLKPLPGTYWPPTAKAMMEEEFLVKKYWRVERQGCELLNHVEHRNLKQPLPPNSPSTLFSGKISQPSVSLSSRKPA